MTAKKITRIRPEEIAGLVDMLGSIEGQIAALRARADTVKEQLKSFGPATYAGEIYESLVFSQERSRIDWHTIADLYRIPGRIIADHTELSTVLVCRTEPRKAAVAGLVASGPRAGAAETGERPPRGSSVRPARH